MAGVVRLSIEQEDITTFDADVVALKYAQSFYGADRLIASRLNQAGAVPLDSLRPMVGSYRYIKSFPHVQARYVLFVGVPDLIDFNYEQIRIFSARVLNILATQAPTTRHLAMTIHGTGYGLDEAEAFMSQIAGYLDATHSGRSPSYLEHISIVNRDPDQVERLRLILNQNIALSGFSTMITYYGHNMYLLSGQQESTSPKEASRNAEALRQVGKGSEEKPHIFVAMPFHKDMKDVFHFGIEQPVRESGFLCERVDQAAFVGNVLDRVKRKIETASIVIAELTGANPNVYLEVGYAWGKGRPTILLVKDSKELLFDVQGQKCLTYESIYDLQHDLGWELQKLKKAGLI